MDATFQLDHNGQPLNVRIVSGTGLGLVAKKPEGGKGQEESPTVEAAWRAAEEQGLVPGPHNMAELFLEQHPNIALPRIVHVVSDEDPDGMLRYIEAGKAVPYPKRLEVRHQVECLYMFMSA